MSSNQQTQQLIKIFPAGTVVGHDGKDQFVIEEVTSSGGEAIVYRAKSKTNGRFVALKLLYVLTDERELQRFLRVKEIHTKVRGVNILPLLQAGIHKDGEDKYPYFVTPFFFGGITLQDILNKACEKLPLDGKHNGTVIPYAELLHYAIQTGSGLLSLHDHGVMHRDVKLSNILVSGQGTGSIVRLMDLGLSKMFGVRVEPTAYKVTQLGEIKGTPCYMAPEAVSGNPTIMSDVWAFGAVLYELITGRTAFNFESGNMHSVMRKVVSGCITPLPIEDYCTNVNENLVKLVLGCMAHDPEERPQSMLDILDELNKLQLDLDNVSQNSDPFLELHTAPNSIDPSAATMAATSTPQGMLAEIESKHSGGSTPSVVVNVTPTSLPALSAEDESDKTDTNIADSAGAGSNRKLTVLVLIVLTCMASFFAYMIWQDSRQSESGAMSVSSDTSVYSSANKPVQKSASSRAVASSPPVTLSDVLIVPSASVVKPISTVPPEPTKSAAPKSGKRKPAYSRPAPLPLPGVDYVPGADGP
ncbi:MAG: protein kinase [Patescibacteria group bacterium]|nr:protein kinase [Patescibacteria group bacterium]